jgi:hypothetical protein
MAIQNKGLTLREWAPGEPLDHRKLNEVVRALRSLLQGARPPTQVNPVAGVSIPVFQQFTIASIGEDVLICNPFDGTASDETSEIIIAKPPELRASREEWNDITYTYTNSQTRTADDGSETEDQVIVPEYVVGDVIYAVKNIVGGTGVVVTDPVEWLDLNVAGRAWAKSDE